MWYAHSPFSYLDTQLNCTKDIPMLSGPIQVSCKTGSSQTVGIILVRPFQHLQWGDWSTPAVHKHCNHNFSGSCSWETCSAFTQTFTAVLLWTNTFYQCQSSFILDGHDKTVTTKNWGRPCGLGTRQQCVVFVFIFVTNEVMLAHSSRVFPPSLPYFCLINKNGKTDQGSF